MPSAGLRLWHTLFPLTPESDGLILAQVAPRPERGAFDSGTPLGITSTGAGQPGVCRATFSKRSAPVREAISVDPKRSANMARIGQRDTAPELAVRRSLHSLGYRFRLHRRDLPGTPDIALPRHRLAVLVHGCFWHRHPH